VNCYYLAYFPDTINKKPVLPIVLCRCDMWALSARRKHKLHPLENNVRSEVVTVMNIVVKHWYLFTILNSATYRNTVNLI